MQSKQYCTNCTSKFTESANLQKIEDDWLEQFMVKAGRISSKEFQWIWGKTLARECNNPGSNRLLCYIFWKEWIKMMQRLLLLCVDCQCN